jgi:hypothetical protein
MIVAHLLGGNLAIGDDDYLAPVCTSRAAAPFREVSREPRAAAIYASGHERVM